MLRNSSRQKHKTKLKMTFTTFRTSRRKSVGRARQPSQTFWSSSKTLPAKFCLMK